MLTDDFGNAPGMGLVPGDPKVLLFIAIAILSAWDPGSWELRELEKGLGSNF